MIAPGSTFLTFRSRPNRRHGPEVHLYRFRTPGTDLRKNGPASLVLPYSRAPRHPAWGQQIQRKAASYLLDISRTITTFFIHQPPEVVP